MRIISPKITLNPLFSCIISLYILILLYFPNWISLKILLSPVFVIMGSILLYLLRLDAIQEDNTENFSKTEETEFSGEEEHKRVGSGKEPESMKSPKSQFDNPAPVHFQAKELIIGNWRRVASGVPLELIMRIDFGSSKLSLEVVHNTLMQKIEIKWDDIVALRTYKKKDESEVLTFKVSKLPKFCCCLNKKWEEIFDDFTGGAAVGKRSYIVICAPGVLFRNFDLLLQCFKRLNDLANVNDSSTPTPSSKCSKPKGKKQNPTHTSSASVVSVRLTAKEHARAEASKARRIKEKLASVGQTEKRLKDEITSRAQELARKSAEEKSSRRYKGGVHINPPV